jgi:hypothetical protein
MREEVVFAACNSIAKDVLMIVKMSDSDLLRKGTFWLEGLGSPFCCSVFTKICWSCLAMDGGRLVGGLSLGDVDN